MIGYAEQKGSYVFVYNTNGDFMWNCDGTLVDTLQKALPSSVVTQFMSVVKEEK